MSFTWVVLASGMRLLFEGAASQNELEALAAGQMLGVRAQRTFRTDPDIHIVAQKRRIDLWTVIDDCNPPRRVEQIRAARFLGKLYVMGNDGSAHAEAAVLNAGADGFCAMPVARDVLVARLRSLLRLADSGTYLAAVPSDPEQLSSARPAVVGPAEYVLSPRESEVVDYLRARAGTWVQRELLMREVFGSRVAYDSSLVRTHLLNIKRKLGAHAPHLRSDRHKGVMWLETIEQAG